jgi:hypothetical protein
VVLHCSGKQSKKHSQPMQWFDPFLLQNNAVTFYGKELLLLLFICYRSCPAKVGGNKQKERPVTPPSRL